MPSVNLSCSFPLAPLIQKTSVVDRKSGSVGMPRPISYAVFCLQKRPFAFSPLGRFLHALDAPDPRSRGRGFPDRDGPLRVERSVRFPDTAAGLECLFFLNDTAPTEFSPLSPRHSLPI